MQMVKKILIGLFALWLALLVFMPKRALYFKLENALSKQGVVIDEKRINEGFFTLNIEDATIYVKGIEVAKVKEINLFTLLFYSSANVELLVPDSSLKAMVPEKIDHIHLTHSVLSPFKVQLASKGSFGQAEGFAAIKTRKLRVDFVETKDIESIKRELTKDDKGWHYETSF